MKGLDELRKRRPCRVQWSIEAKGGDPEIQTRILSLTQVEARLLRRNLENTVGVFRDRETG